MSPMTTPICDFVRGYAEGRTTRLHMPGHKGQPYLGCEPWDITEVHGADSLWAADGIISESEDNASSLFGCPTFYSTEGSSLCIRAMLWLAKLAAERDGRTPVIAAGRNAHRTFLAGCALLELPIRWLWPEGEGADGYLACPLTPAGLEGSLTAWEAEGKDVPTAVYLTTPDYLGHTLPLEALADVCHAHGMLLLVDNAHGAYLRFLTPSLHPMDAGVDLCCDSAHKTLPCLTGAAYLHLSPGLPAWFCARAKESLALFGSTSPSYLILQSLDAANAELSGDYPARLQAAVETVAALRGRLTAHGFSCIGDEGIKLTVSTRPCGYTGDAVADYLRDAGMECEFSDPDYIVFMITPDTPVEALDRLGSLLTALPRKAALPSAPDPLPSDRPRAVMTPRQALLAPREMVPVTACAGRVLADIVLSCPPAVPLVVCGERITPSAAEAMAYYGTETVAVVVE